MSLYIVDNKSKYVEELISLFSSYEPHIASYREIDRSSLQPDDIVILSGGHGSPVLWHDKEYAKELDIIKHHRGPVIGICLGFQLIAHAFDSSLHFLPERSKGEKEIYITEEGRGIFSRDRYTVYENHNWSVRQLKHPLVPLATSSDGVEILQHANLPIYGLQFHPEHNANNDILSSIFTQFSTSFTIPTQMETTVTALNSVEISTRHK